MPKEKTAAELAVEKRGYKTQKGKYLSDIPDKIIEYISSGMSKKLAAQSAGIQEKSFYRWIEQHPEFAAKVVVAEGEFINSNLKIIQTAAHSKWNAAAWLLERTRPEFFSKHMNVKTASNERKVSSEEAKAIKKLREDPELLEKAFMMSLAENEAKAERQQD